MSNSNGKNIFWGWALGKFDEESEVADFDAIAKAGVSITPIKVDLTAIEQLPTLEKWLISA